jgi:hypothetical protein
MDPRSSPKEIVFGVGTFLALAAAAGLMRLSRAKFAPTAKGHLEVLFGICLLVGVVMHLAGFISLSGGRRYPISVKPSPGGFPWFGLAAIILWIVILPFVLLRAYEYVYRR